MTPVKKKTVKPKEKKLRQVISFAIKQIDYQALLSRKVKVREEMFKLYKEIKTFMITLQQLTEDIEFKRNYTKKIKLDIEDLIQHFPYSKNSGNNIESLMGSEITREQFKAQFSMEYAALSEKLLGLKFTVNFFDQLGFFKDNIVAVGANGSGKTTLSLLLRHYLTNSGIVISAQRLLWLPVFDHVKSAHVAAKELAEFQKTNKPMKTVDEMKLILEEFRVVMQNVVANNVAAAHKYRLDALRNAQFEESISDPPATILDKILEIWNSVIKHRKIECEDGVNITGREFVKQYPVAHMSDGEKAILFLSAQVLLCPKDGFIVVDEPEMHLHKIIHQELWDKLEAERPDCIFIYLTHDLDFAVSRTSAKKLWIKNYRHQHNSWEIEEIPDNVIPEQLLMELLGSQKNILFCEGDKTSDDQRIYRALFPGLTIVPVESCTEVINYTKAFNKLPIKQTQAFGIIDRDFHDEKRLQSLHKERVFSMTYAEIENILLTESFLKLLGTQLMKEEGLVKNIKKSVLNDLKKDLHEQTSSFVTEKINLYFKGSHMERGKTQSEVEEKYRKFTEDISIAEWYQARIDKLKDIIEERDYHRALEAYNNKGLKRIVNFEFNIKDFTDQAIKFIERNQEAKAVLIELFPIELKRAQH